MQFPFIASVYWSARRETVQECARRIAAALRALADCSGTFERWFQDCVGSHDPVRHAVAADEGRIAALLLEGTLRGDHSGEVLEGGGYSLWLWNAAAQPKEVALHVHCGSYSPWGGNAVVLDLPLDREKNADIMNFAALRRILLILVRCFEPESGVVTHSDLRDGILGTPVEEPTAGWLTYLSRKYGVTASSADFEVERIGHFGELLVATREPFDIGRADHVGAARKIARRIKAAAQAPSEHEPRN